MALTAWLVPSTIITPFGYTGFTNPNNAKITDGVFATASNTPSTNPISIFIVDSQSRGNGGFVSVGSTLQTNSTSTATAWGGAAFTLSGLIAGDVYVIAVYSHTGTVYGIGANVFDFSSIPTGSTINTVGVQAIHKYTTNLYSIDSIAMQVNFTPPAPVTDFIASQTNGFTNQALSFTDTSTNLPTSWSWTFGDGGTSTAQNPSHTYTSAGTYTVVLIATNDGGSNTKTKTSYITITDPKTIQGISSIQGLQSITL